MGPEDSRTPSAAMPYDFELPRIPGTNEVETASSRSRSSFLSSKTKTTVESLQVTNREETVSSRSGRSSFHSSKAKAPAESQQEMNGDEPVASRRKSRLSVFSSSAKSPRGDRPASTTAPSDQRPKWISYSRRMTASTFNPTSRMSFGSRFAPSISRRATEDDMAQLLSMDQRKFSNLNDGKPSTSEKDINVKELDKRMDRIFGRTRQKRSEEERTRHLGVVFKNVTVKGQALGNSVQSTVGDVFLSLPRYLGDLLSRDGEAKLRTKTILNKFTGCIQPGEMLLVLGRPGSGVSSFLKLLANQRGGFEKVEGKVTYGGESAELMGEKFRSETLYTPEADLHYSTLKVKDTLKFALKSRTPASHSRKDGESRDDYVSDFFQMATKIFWIEHTVDTIVGNEFTRGVSGGEKRRVSIAEALVTKASVQCWDDPTRGLDSSAALEYIRILRSMTTTARIATAVGLYQASEDMWDYFDKVLLIDGGECCYYGPTKSAVQYFKDLGFEMPARSTSADFLTSVSSEHQRRIRPGFEQWIPRSPRDFAMAYRASEQRQYNHMDIAYFEAKLYGMMEKRMNAQSSATETKNYALPYWKQVVILAHRQALVLKGDPQTLSKSNLQHAPGILLT